MKTICVAARAVSGSAAQSALKEQRLRRSTLRAVQSGVAAQASALRSNDYRIPNLISELTLILEFVASRCDIDN